MRLEPKKRCAKNSVVPTEHNPSTLRCARQAWLSVTSAGAEKTLAALATERTSWSSGAAVEAFDLPPAVRTSSLCFPHVSISAAHGYTFTPYAESFPSPIRSVPWATPC